MRHEGIKALAHAEAAGIYGAQEKAAARHYIQGFIDGMEALADQLMVMPTGRLRAELAELDHERAGREVMPI